MSDYIKSYYRLMFYINNDNEYRTWIINIQMAINKIK